MPFDGVDNTARDLALAKMDRVISLLAHEHQWCKQQLRTRSGKHCIQGAMIEADATNELREPILTAIRQVTGRDYARIEMFNDQPLTTHALVLTVLRQARRSIAEDASWRVTREPMARTPHLVRPALARLRALLA